MDCLQMWNQQYKAYFQLFLLHPPKESWKDPDWTDTIHESMNVNGTIVMAEPVLWLASGMLWKKRMGVFLLQLLPSLSAPQIDSQCLEREVAAISVVEWILPPLLENKCSKNKLLWEASEQQWRKSTQPTVITHLVAFWDKVRVCSQGCVNASLSAVL